MWRDFTRVIQMPFFRQLVLAEALVALAIAGLVITFLPFRKIAAWMGTAGLEAPIEATEHQVEAACLVGWAVETLAGRVPWESRCLCQALAANGMLRRRGLEGTIRFGAAREPFSDFIAHASLRFGTYLVTGKDEDERFQTITSFSRKRA